MKEVELTVGELFDIMGFKEQGYYFPTTEIEIDTPFGWKRIEDFTITQENQEWEIETENNLGGIFADDHKFETLFGEFDEANNRKWSKLQTLKIGDEINTKFGFSKIIKIINLNTKSHMYDVGVDDVKCYYSNDVVSHNTTSIKWLKKIAKENDINFRRFDDPKDFLENTQGFYLDKKSIFVFEDFDGFLQERDETGGSPNMFLSKILNTLDGTEEIENVVTIFTTNHPEIFDKALLRPGRIDKLIMFETPNKDQIRELLNIYIPEYASYFDLIVDEVKKKTQDVSYAILKGICDDINILAFNKIEITEGKIKDIVESKLTSANKGSSAKKASDYIL